MKTKTIALASVLGLAGVAGVISLAVQAKDWPAPIKALEAQGVQVMGTFKAPGGLTGYAGAAGQQPIAIYLTADEKYAIVGPMIDAQGKNLSSQPLASLVSKPLTDRAWSLLEKSSWVADGKKSAPRIVYVFTDPNCPYCTQFWNAARPWVDGGKVQLRHVMVGILGPTSPAKAAAILAARDPALALKQHEQQHAQGGVKPLASIPPAIQSKLAANESLMQHFGAQATPTILFKDSEGHLQSVQGAPPANQLPLILGPR